jgi:selenide,water dikinase
LAPAELERILRPIRATFRAADHPDLLVGLAAADDAAVYRLNEQQAVVSTVDFFPPIVDDPYDFGAIAAANALSDVYAMGGEVLFAVNLVAFPDALDKSILAEILRGGAEKVAEAGAVIAGGHSVNDKEPKYGLAVTGLIAPGMVQRKGGAQPGDFLLLTKPLGVGVITTALKHQRAAADHLAAAVASMKRLNRAAAQAAQAAGARAMTDITGFGLLGHAQEMARQGATDFRFGLSRLPWLPGAVDYGRDGAFPGGMGNNAVFFSSSVTFADDIEYLYRDLLFTPETSGGLLVAVPPAGVAAFLGRLPDAAVVGRVTAGTGHIWVDTGDIE